MADVFGVRFRVAGVDGWCTGVAGGFVTAGRQRRRGAAGGQPGGRRGRGLGARRHRRQPDRPGCGARRLDVRQSSRSLAPRAQRGRAGGGDRSGGRCGRGVAALQRVRPVGRAGGDPCGGRDDRLDGRSVGHQLGRRNAEGGGRSGGGRGRGVGTGRPPAQRRVNSGRGAFSGWCSVSLGELSLPGESGEQDDESPGVALDRAGDAFAVWEHFDGTNFVVQSAVHPAGATKFSAPVDVSLPQSTAHEDAVGPRVAVDAAGDEIVVWALGGGSDGQHWAVQAAARPAGAARFGAPLELSVAGQNQDPQVAVDQAGDAVAVWQRFDGASAFVDAASLPAGTSTWSTVELAGAADPSSPQVALDAAGDAVAVWNDTNSVNQTVGTAIDRPAEASAPPVRFRARARTQPTRTWHWTRPGRPTRSGWALTARTRWFKGSYRTRHRVPGHRSRRRRSVAAHHTLACRRVHHKRSRGYHPVAGAPSLSALRVSPSTFAAAGRVVAGHCLNVTRANHGRRRCTRAIALKVKFQAHRRVDGDVQDRTRRGRPASRQAVRDGNNAYPKGASLHPAARPAGKNHQAGPRRHATASCSRAVSAPTPPAPGSYRLTATPSANGHVGQPVTASFRIVP